MDVVSDEEPRLLLSLAVGLLIGVERERRRSDPDYAIFAGLRTFALVDLLGGLLAYLHLMASREPHRIAA